MKTSNIVCFGEVLWDKFPTYKKIGGAPLNVALRLSSFGNKVHMISKVGKDELGEELLAYITQKGLDTNFIKTDNTYETSIVKVMLNEKGSASYEIKFPCAWDYIDITDEMKVLVSNTDAFIYGSLVSRNEHSRASLQELLKHANYKVFDVNLRSPHYTKELLIALMKEADFIKLNDDELFEISSYLGSKYNSIEQNIHYISEATKTQHICVTKGSHGAVLLYNGKFYYNSGYLVKVADTVGAGDSFLASLISQLLNTNDPQRAIDFACAVGALVAQSEGANPIITNETIDKFMDPYK